MNQSLILLHFNVKLLKSVAWFNFGCCALELEKWGEAAKAYRECIRYEPTHFQAWNNLAAVYERLSDAERAKAVLQVLFSIFHVP